MCPRDKQIKHKPYASGGFLIHSHSRLNCRKCTFVFHPLKEPLELDHRLTILRLECALGIDGIADDAPFAIQFYLAYDNCRRLLPCNFATECSFVTRESVALMKRKLILQSLRFINIAFREKNDDFERKPAWVFPQQSSTVIHGFKELAGIQMRCVKRCLNWSRTNSEKLLGANWCRRAAWCNELVTFFTDLKQITHSSLRFWSISQKTTKSRFYEPRPQ